MIRDLKVLWLALVACLVLSTLGAAPAKAQGKFTFEPANGLQLVGEQDGTGSTALQKFTTTSGSVECEEVHGEATLSSTEATEITAQNIKYQNAGKIDQCNGPLGSHPKIEFNGCDYLFASGQTIGQTGMETTGSAQIKCPESKQITVTATGCQIHIPAQTPSGGHVVYHTVTAAPNDITAEATITGIQYQGTELCSSASSGQYTGNITVKAYGIPQIGIEVH